MTYIEPQIVEGCEIYAPIPVRIKHPGDGRVRASVDGVRWSWEAEDTQEAARHLVSALVFGYLAYSKAEKLTPRAEAELEVLRKYIRAPQQPGTSS